MPRSHRLIGGEGYATSSVWWLLRCCLRFMALCKPLVRRGGLFLEGGSKSLDARLDDVRGRTW